MMMCVSECVCACTHMCVCVKFCIICAVSSHLSLSEPQHTQMTIFHFQFRNSPAEPRPAVWTHHGDNSEFVDEQWTAGLSRGTATPSYATHPVPFPFVIVTALPTTSRSLTSSASRISAPRFLKQPACVTFSVTTVSPPPSRGAPS